MGTNKIIKNITGFREWQSSNQYLGKKISILGDSISTFENAILPDITFFTQVTSLHFQV